MNQNYDIRPAAQGDTGFIIEAIIGAEKSGTDKFGLAALFQMTEEELKPYLRSILEEEVDGCEFSISSFLLATYDGQPVAAMAGWVEGGNEDEMPSALLKANLLGFVLPVPSDTGLFSLMGQQLKGVQIDREEGTYQIEYVYVCPQHRGRGLTQKLMEAHRKKGLAERNVLNKMQVQAFANNRSAVKAYEKMGFGIVGEFCGETELLRYLPDHIKLLLEKNY